jgi:hypothetical protein
LSELYWTEQLPKLLNFQIAQSRIARSQLANSSVLPRLGGTSVAHNTQ